MALKPARRFLPNRIPSGFQPTCSIHVRPLSLERLVSLCMRFQHLPAIGPASGDPRAEVGYNRQRLIPQQPAADSAQITQPSGRSWAVLADAIRLPGASRAIPALAQYQAEEYLPVQILQVKPIWPGRRARLATTRLSSGRHLRMRPGRMPSSERAVARAWPARVRVVGCVDHADY